MNEKMIDKLNTLDRIEYKIEENEIKKVSYYKYFLLLVGLIAYNGCIYMEGFDEATWILSFSLIGFIIMTILNLIFSVLGLNKLDKKYLDKLEIKSKK